MGIKLAFITGARSEYGLAKALLKEMQSDSRIDLKIIVNGMHLLKKYGETIHEILDDGFSIEETIATYTEEGQSKAKEFSNSIAMLSESISRVNPDVALIIGDRLEAYAAALACHFAGVPIVHSGGGHLTRGAVDDTYRFNITNLATVHLTTCVSAYNRLVKVPLVDQNDVYLIGSVGVDAIVNFLKNPVPVYKFIPGLKGRKFALVTYHPVTKVCEPVPLLIKETVEYLTQHGINVLITYPNNDRGSRALIDMISMCRESDGVFVAESLGAQGYYAALNDCCFVVGNSSSGLSEAPYFRKKILNVGARQEGRDKDVGVIDVPADGQSLRLALEKASLDASLDIQCNNLFGDGSSVSRAIKVICERFSAS